MAACILTFNIVEPTLTKLRLLCTGINAELRAVDRRCFCANLAALVSGKDVLQSALDAGFDEEMLVMAGLSQEQFDMFLDGMKRFGVPRIALKAVLTPHNAGWSANRLYRELCAERDAFEKRRKS